MLKDKIKTNVIELINSNQFLLSTYHWYSRIRRWEWESKKKGAEIIAYRIDQSGLTTLNSTLSVKPSSRLPDSVVMDKDEYTFFDENFDCSLPGLYRFVSLGNENRQHVVLDCKDSVASALYLSLLSVRGNRDQITTPSRQAKIAIQRFLSVTCWQNSFFVHRILEEQGIFSRVVSSHTAEVLNSYNDGHVLIEVFSSKLRKHVLVDVDKKAIFVDTEPLSLFELSKNIYLGKDFSMESISNVAMTDWNGFCESGNGFSYGFIEQALSHDSEYIKKCIERICQVPMILSSGQVYVCAWDRALAQRLSEIDSSWTILSADEYSERFYNDRRS